MTVFLGGGPLVVDILLGHAYFLKYDVVERRVMKPYPPLGILYLSAYLKRGGFDVEVFDATFQDFEDFEQTLERVRPRIVGLYANIITRDNVLRLTRIAKDSGVEFVIVGGPDAASGATRTSGPGSTSSEPTKARGRWSSSSPGSRTRASRVWSRCRASSSPRTDPPVALRPVP